MLLYIFGHWQRSDVEASSHEADEAEFQRALRSAAPDGLIDRVVQRLAGATWASKGGEVYEDLYLLQNSTALDVLNEAAVHGACEEPHDRLARAMLAGTAGLYGHSLGAPLAAPARSSRWFRKPPGMTYATLYSALSEAAGRDGASLWRRQMVLSPAPEFCAFGFHPGAVLPELETSVVRRTPCWPIASGADQ